MNNSDENALKDSVDRLIGRLHPEINAIRNSKEYQEAVSEALSALEKLTPFYTYHA